MRMEPWEFDLDAMEDFDCVIGVDEAGRGALAGPVVAGAVCLRREFYETEWCRRHSGRVDDSKKLNCSRRECLFAEIMLLKREGMLMAETGVAGVAEIEKENILGATRTAMRRALEAIAASGLDAGDISVAGPRDSLFVEAHEECVERGMERGYAGSGIRILIDGRPLRPFPYRHDGIVKGDSKSLAIAMASIVAKVNRDSLMCKLDREYPQFAFAEHKGYATLKHQAAILNYGPSPVHRPTFLRKLLAADARETQLDLQFAK